VLSSTHSCCSTAHCHPSHQRRIVSSTSSRPSQSQSAWQRCSRMAHRRRQSLFSSSEFLASPPSLEQGYEFLHPSAEGLIQNLVSPPACSSKNNASTQLSSVSIPDSFSQGCVCGTRSITTAVAGWSELFRQPWSTPVDSKTASPAVRWIDRGADPSSRTSIKVPLIT